MRSLSREFIPKGDYQQRRYEIYEKQCTGTGPRRLYSSRHTRVSV